MRLIIIDKDKTLNQNLAFFFKNKGFVVDSAYSGEDGLELTHLYEYDVLMLSYHLPDMSGLDLLKRLRTANLQAPILIYSINSSVSVKIDCLTHGADDYVVKPCDKGELLARLKALVRRSRGYAHPIIHIGDMSVNLDAKQVKIKDTPLPLTGKEYALIELLALKQGSTVSKEQFLNHLYGGMDEPELKIIDVFLFRIRDKIKQIAGSTTYIQTVWGRGYILKQLP